MKKIGEWLKKNCWIVLLLGFFLISSLWLTAGIPHIVNSPDENANLFFAEIWSETGSLRVDESVIPHINHLIHPRSITVFEGNLVPGSFIGLPVLYGLMGLLSKGLIPYITPVIAIIGLLAFRRSIFLLTQDQRIANWSFFFLAIHPAFWHYAARTMMHNIGFVSFLIIAFWIFIENSFQKIWHHRVSPFLSAFLSGFVFALALAFRTSEIVWILPLTMILLFWFRKYLTWKRLGVFAIGIILILTPFLLIQQSTYGSYFVTGYQVEDQVVEDDAILMTEIDNQDSSLISLLLPFGFHEKTMLFNAWYYGFWLYPWLMLFTVLGLIMVVFRYKHIDLFWRRLIPVFIAISVWLIILYGSWVIVDNPDPSAITIANSYTRYWLPIFILAAPFFAYAMKRIYEVLPNRIGRSLMIVLALILFGFSSYFVFLGHDGFVSTRENLFASAEKREEILNLTEDDSIIIVDRADKFLFPDRSVVQPLRDESTYAAMPNFVQQATLYYYGITLPQKDIDYLNDVKLGEMNLGIEFIATIGDESLYRIYAK